MRKILCIVLCLFLLAGCNQTSKTNDEKKDSKKGISDILKEADKVVDEELLPSQDDWPESNDDYTPWDEDEPQTSEAPITHIFDEAGDEVEAVLVPVEYIIDEDKNIIVDEQRIFLLFEYEELGMKEEVESLVRIDIPDQEIYLLSTIGIGYKENGIIRNLIVNGKSIELPFVTHTEEKEVWTLSDSYIFLKSQTPYGSKLDIIDINTLRSMNINDLINESSIYRFDVNGQVLIVEANDTNPWMYISQEGYKSYELDLSEILQ